MRVYELAKEFHLSTKAFRKLLKDQFQLDYKSHMSAMEEDDVARVRKYLSEKSTKDHSKNQGERKQGPKQDKPSVTKCDKKPASKDPKKEHASAQKPAADKKSDQQEKHNAVKKSEKKHHHATKPGEEGEDRPNGRHHNGGDKKNRRSQNPKNFSEKEQEFDRPVKNKKKAKKKAVKEESPVEDDFDQIIEIPKEITVSDFAKEIHKNSMDVITELIKLGVMASLNESITFETAEQVAEKFGILITEPEETDTDEIFDRLDFEDKEEDLKSRPPVITVMGHVDHGKTSLLDSIRKTSVTRGEAGGITQHIGASTVIQDGKQITFLDTPGHEAFTQMRSRGAKTTDIVILVVAADDGVMPQTIEAINHAKAAKVPIVVAINKIDKEGADPNRVMQELTEYDLIPEEWGGDTIMIPVSAKNGQGIDDLLQMVLMVAEMEELKANPNRPAIGVVIESQLEKGRGATASILVQKGTLTDKDYVVSGQVSGHIRAMYDARGKVTHKAGPSDPVKIIGLSDLPEAGEHIYAVADEKIAREFAEKAQERARKEKLNKTTHVSLDDLHMQISEEGLKELNIIVKTDVKGTIDALTGSIEKLSNEEVKVNIIHGAVGGISESDVMLAVASNAIIIGFNVRPNQGAIAQAAREEIDIRTYRVIYDAIEDIKKAIIGMLKPTLQEEVLGRAEVRDTFKVPNAGTVAGIYVTSGKIVRNAMIRLLRNNIVIHEGVISSLRRFKDDVKEIGVQYEGGLGIENYNDIKVGDEMECYHEIEVKPKTL